MLTLNKTFDDTRAIKVLVVPIGDNSQFDRQFEIVSKRRSVPMYELNRPSADARPTNTPFKSLNWEAGGGALLFDYLRYDRVSSGLGDLDSFQCNRRYLHVIGLINFPELEGSQYRHRLEEDMDYYTRRYPNVILRRYFVFNMFNHPNSNSWSIPSIPNDPNAIVVFPPDGECGGGNSMIDIHLHEVMAGTALKILMALELQAAAVCDESRLRASAHSKIPPGINLFTTYDEMEEGAMEGNGQGGISLVNASSKMKKRIGGRLRKITGDLCLQGCSPLDALENFIAAISECKSQGDSMWLAGAYEGFASSILSCLELKIPLDDIVGRELKTSLQSGLSLGCAVIRLAEERCVDALALHGRNMAFAGLEVECSLKVARMYEEAVGAVADREQKVLEFLLRAVSVPGLNRQQQMECTLEAAFVCSRLKLKRKYAFFLFLAALFAADSENSTVTHLMMKCALQQYGVNFNEEEAHAEVTTGSYQSGIGNSGDEGTITATSTTPHPPGGEDGEAVGRNQSWVGMRRLLYAQCAYLGKEAGDVVSSARCLAGMLRLLAEADIQWRRSTSSWLPHGFTPDAIPRLFLTCSNTAAASGSPGYGGVDRGASHSLSVNTRDRGIGFERSASSAPTYDSSNSNISNSVNSNSNGGWRSPSPAISSLSSSHNMASVRKIYSKANYQRFHAKMRMAGGRIVDLHDNIAKQVLEFSLHSDERDRDGGGYSDSFSDTASVRGGVSGGSFVPGFLSSSNDRDTPGKSNAAPKRKITVPKLESFVTSLTYRPSVSHLHKQHSLPRSSSISTVVGTLAGLGHTGDPLANDSTNGTPSSNHPGVGLLDSGPPTPTHITPSPSPGGSASLGGSLFSAFHSSVATPTIITSRIMGTPELACSAMLSVGLADETGGPTLGALTPSTNCISRTWLNSGSGGNNTAVGLDKLTPLQDGCIKRLEKYCNEVPPSCPVYMGEMPFLVSMRPLDLPANSRPCPISRPTPPSTSVYCRDSTSSAKPEPESDASALYYDPFLAKRDKAWKEQSRGPLEVAWAQGLACKVQLCFTNPLCVSMLLSNVALMLQEVTFSGTVSENSGDVVSGDKCYEVTPESVEIPSVVDGGECFYTTLSVMPIRPCRLKLVGIRFFIRNAMYVSLIDNDGFGTPKRKELSSPWTYPRRARDPKREESEKKKQNNTFCCNTSGIRSSSAAGEGGSNMGAADVARGVSMLISVAPAAAGVRVSPSWTRGSSSNSSSGGSNGSRGQHTHSTIISTTPATPTTPPATTTTTSTASLSLCDGECRRETVVLRNISDTLKIQDLRVSMLYTPCTQTESRKSSSHGGGRQHKNSSSKGGGKGDPPPVMTILLPWGGSLKDNAGNTTTGHDGSKVSAKAAAAISDHKSYIAEKKEKARLEQERLGIENSIHNNKGKTGGEQTTDTCTEEDDEEECIYDAIDLNYTPPTDPPPFVRVVAVECVDYASCKEGTEAVDDSGSDGIRAVCPIPASKSVRLVLEFVYREDILPVLPNCSGGGEQPFGTNVTFILSYHSSAGGGNSSSKSSSKATSFPTDVVYYRNYSFDVLVCREPGISLFHLSAICPGSCIGGVGSPLSKQGGYWRGDNEPDSAAITTVDDVAESCYDDVMHEGESNVVDHLAALLAGGSSIGGHSSTSRGMHSSSSTQCGLVQVVGDTWFLVMQFSNQSSNMGVVYAPSSSSGIDTGDISVPIGTGNQLQGSEDTRCFFEEDEFLNVNLKDDNSNGNDNNSATVFARLPPFSSKYIYIRLSATGIGEKKPHPNILVSKLRIKLRSICWCYISDKNACRVTRRGDITTRRLPADVFSSVSKDLVRPPVAFLSERLEAGKISSNMLVNAEGTTNGAGEGQAEKKMFHLSMPSIDQGNDLLSSSMLASFKLTTIPIKTRTFYNFTVKVGLARASVASRRRMGVKRQLELAVIVFEGHHVGLTQVGPGTGKEARARLGASYILPVVSVDPLPAAAAAAVAVASSGSMEGGKAISLIEMGTHQTSAEPRADSSGGKGGIGGIGPTEQTASSILLPTNAPTQASMVCSGVLVTGQLRRVFDVVNTATPQPIDHSIKLCFTSAGKYTIYTLARELRSENSTSCCKTNHEIQSPWWLDSSPVLLSVSPLPILQE